MADLSAPKTPKPISPLAETVLRTLRRRIVEGEFPANRPLPSERALAEMHSVSRTVVREAVGALASEGMLLQTEGCRRVVASLAPHRRRRTAPRVGVWLWPHAEDAFASAILRGIQRAARGTGASIVISAAPHVSWEDDVAAEARFVRSLVEDEADGAILWYLGGSKNLPALREARGEGVEFVFVDRCPPKGFEADFVGTENVGAARRAAAHLIELGHQRIAFVGNLDTASTVEERRKGFFRGLSDAGLTAVAELAFAPQGGEPEIDAARRVAQEILALSPRPTGLFVVNDSVALVVLAALREFGMAVPEEISIVGFDGQLHWLPGGGPLTTVRQDFTTVGERAGEALFARLEPDAPLTYRHVLLDSPLSLGGSTALLRSPHYSPRENPL